MRFVYNDGGRSQYFKAKNVGDCVSRAICNATGMDYKEVYTSLQSLTKKEVERLERKCVSPRLSPYERERAYRRFNYVKRATVRNGTMNTVYKKYLKSLGYTWVGINKGAGEVCRLTDDRFSKGTYIIAVSKHLTCIKDGVLIDTYDCSRDGERTVYGYYQVR